MDFLSTWIATPNLVLEGNPLAKKLGWKWGVPLNVVICLALPLWPLSAIVVSTASVLVAARNFQSAWLMRSLGEEIYRRWHVERVRKQPSRFTFLPRGQHAAHRGRRRGFDLVQRLAGSSVRHRHGHDCLCHCRGVLHAARHLAYPRAAKREARELAAQYPHPDGRTVTVGTCSPRPAQSFKLTSSQDTFALGQKQSSNHRAAIAKAGKIYKK